MLTFRPRRVSPGRVEHALVPHDLGVVIELRRRRDVGERGVVTLERAIGGNGGAARDDLRHGHRGAVLPHLDEVANPDLRGVALGGFHPRKVEKSLVVGRDVDVPHGLEGGPDEKPEGFALRMHESEDRYLVRNLVRAGAGGQGDEQDRGHGQSAQ
jgi:hypothetical protein